jgi:hypothetical protein
MNKDFYTTLTMLNTQQYNSLVKYYGEFWYEKFFISYHINSQKQIINNNNTKKNAIIAKYNKTWYNKHIVNLSNIQLSYSFASVYSNYFLIKRKIKSQTVKTGVDYRTYNTEITQDTQTGGDTETIDTTDTTEDVTVDEDTEESDKNEVIDEYTIFFSVEFLNCDREPSII